MNFEVGKYYKTRAGRKAYLAAVTAPCPFPGQPDDEYPLCGYIEGYRPAMVWDADGRISKGCTVENDLVAEWKDPVKVAGWVNVYSHYRSQLHKTREIADGNSDDSRIACIYVEGVEGVEP